MRYAHMLVPFVCAGIVSSPAGATLIEVDLLSPGDGLITLDTETGLEWLDLTDSVSRSFNDVSGEFGPGGDFEGWRHATGEEVCDLFAVYGGMVLAEGEACPGSAVSSSDTTLLRSRLGATTNDEVTVAGFVDLGDAPPGLGLIAEGAVWILLDGGFENNVNSEVGNFLVRSAVPEPSTLALLLLGFGFLVRRAMQSL